MQGLFAYGTLLRPEIQEKLFGRVIHGQRETLPGYRRTLINLGGAVYPNIKPEGTSSVDGQVLLLTARELLAADRYEGTEFERKRVTLESGREVWVYWARTSADG